MSKSFDLKEKTGAKYTTTLKDANGTVISLANISTIALTLYNYADGAIINGREAQDVKDDNNVAIHTTSGLLTWLIQAEDNPIVRPSDIAIGKKEKHIALFEYAYTGDGTPGKHEVYLDVKNLGKVT